MKNRNLVHHDNWETPPELYKKLDDEFHFDFDPCPISFEPITDETDGLLIPWGMFNFVNPPYSRKLKEAFIRRAVDLSYQGKCSVLLLPVSTSSKIFHDVIQPNADEIRFIKGRVKFRGLNSKGELVTKGTGMHDSMIVVFRAKP